MNVIVILAVIVGTAIQFGLLRRVSTQAVPLTGIVVAIVNIVGVTGYFYYPAFAARALVSARLPGGPDIYRIAASAFVTASICLTVGALLVRFRGRIDVEDEKSLQSILTRFPSPGLIVASLVPFVMVAVGTGPTELLYRSQYLATTGPRVFTSVGQNLVSAAVGLLAYLAFDRSRREARIVAAGLLGAYSVLLFSLGTRQLALLPLLLLFGRLQARPSMRPSLIWLVPISLATLALLSLPLSIRSGDAGLLPFAGRVQADPGLLIRFDGAAVFGNVLFAVPLTGTVALVAALRPGDLLTEINPLPSGFTNYAEIVPKLGLNRSTPFNALGELAAQGPAVLVCYFVTVGIVLSMIQRQTDILTGSAKVLVQFINYALAVLFALDVLEYNLRATSRLLYYMIAILVTVRIVQHLLQRSQVRPVRTA